MSDTKRWEVLLGKMAALLVADLHDPAAARRSSYASTGRRLSEATCSR